MPRQSKNAKNNRVKILIDTREAKLLGKLTSMVNDTLLYTVESTRLDIGDIHILQYPHDTSDSDMGISNANTITGPKDKTTNGNDSKDSKTDVYTRPSPDRKLVLERKTVADMISSVKDGRYREQKKRLHAWESRARNNGKYRRVGYILEGYLDTKIHDAAARRLYWGSQISTVLRDNVPVFNTLGTTQTAELIMRLAHRLADPKICGDLFLPFSHTPVPSSLAQPFLENNDGNKQHGVADPDDTRKTISINTASTHTRGCDSGSGSKRKSSKKISSSHATTTSDGVKIIQFEGVNNRDTGIDNGLRGVSPAIPSEDTGIRRVKISADATVYNGDDDNSDHLDGVVGNDGLDIRSKTKQIGQARGKAGNREVRDLDTAVRLSYLDTIIKKKKSSNITPANCHIIMLAQIPGITARSAEAIMTEFGGNMSALFKYLSEASAVDVAVSGRRDKTTGEVTPPTPEQIAKAQRKAHAKALQRLADITIPGTTKGNICDANDTGVSIENSADGEIGNNNSDGDGDKKGRRLGSVLALRLMEYLAMQK